MKITRALAATATLTALMVGSGVAGAAADVTWESSPGPHTFSVDVTPVSYMVDSSGDAALRVEHIVDENGRALLCAQFDRPSPSGTQLRPLGRATPQLAYLANQLEHPELNPDLAGLDAMQQYYVLQFVAHMYDSPHFADFTDVQDGQRVADPHGLIPRITAVKARADAASNGDFFEGHKISVSEPVPASALDPEGFWLSDPVTVSVQTGNAQVTVKPTWNEAATAAGTTLVDAATGAPLEAVADGAQVRLKTSADKLAGRAGRVGVTLDARFDGGTAKIGYLYGGDEQVQQIVGYDEITYNEHLSTDISTAYTPVLGSLSGTKEGSAGERLAGVEFTVKDAGGTALTTVATASDGTFTVPDVPWGTWFLHETKTPEGYLPLSQPVEVTIDGAHRRIDLPTITNDKAPVAKGLSTINTGRPPSDNVLDPALVIAAGVLLGGGVGGGAWCVGSRVTQAMGH